MTTTERLPVFVYGTLRPGWGNARLWAGCAEAHHDGTATVLGYHLTTNGGFPYLVWDDASTTVGTLIEPADEDYDEVLARLDALEGYRPWGRHNHYERVHVVVHTPDGPWLAWTYVPSHCGGSAERARALRPVQRDDEGRYDWNVQRREVRS